MPTLGNHDCICLGHHQLVTVFIPISICLSVLLVVLQETGGVYSVGMSDKHVEECVMDHAPPPPTKASGSAASLVSHHTAETENWGHHWSFS